MNGLAVASKRTRRVRASTAVPVEPTPQIEETVIHVNDDGVCPTSATLDDIENDPINEESTLESFVEAVNTK